MADNELDVRQHRKPDKHPAIFATYADLPVGGSFVLVNNHDPKHLHEEFEADHAGSYGWEYVEKGPTVWRIRISKVTTTPLPRIVTNTADIAAADVEPGVPVPGFFQAKGLGSSDTPGCPKETWCVANAGRYRGSMNVTDALATSPNTAFARLIQLVGVPRAVDMAVRLGCWSSSRRVVRSRTRPPDSTGPSKHSGPNPTERRS